MKKPHYRIKRVCSLFEAIDLVPFWVIDTTVQFGEDFYIFNAQGIFKGTLEHVN